MHVCASVSVHERERRIKQASAHGKTIRNVHTASSGGGWWLVGWLAHADGAHLCQGVFSEYTYKNTYIFSSCDRKALQAGTSSTLKNRHPTHSHIFFCFFLCVVRPLCVKLNALRKCTADGAAQNSITLTPNCVGAQSTACATTNTPSVIKIFVGRNQSLSNISWNFCSNYY